MKIEVRKVSDLQEYHANARVHPAEQVKQIARSIEEFGWTFPILVREDGTVVAGHGRLMAARQLGYSEVPCLVAPDWSDEQARAYTIADNRIAQNSSWSVDDLAAELEMLEGEGLDLSILGFNQLELNAFLGDDDDFEDGIEGTDEGEEGFKQSAVAVGRLRIPITMDQMVRWNERMRDLHDDSESAILADILRRLGL